MNSMKEAMTKMKLTTRGEPALQNIPAPRTAEGQAAAKAFKEAPRYGGSLANFLVQMQNATEQAARSWQRMIDEGYVEVAPGHLRHPDNGTEVISG